MTGPRYDAFISYRHVEPDRQWAQWLRRGLESFRTPKPLVKKGFPPRINRVFRDVDETAAASNLSNELEEALQQSRFLIVVCSPRTAGSEWVNQEVVRFRAMGRHDQILALLIDGEPAESFPHALCEIRTEIADAKGQVIEEIEDVEPLAVDVRPSQDRSARYTKRTAMLRFAATLLGCRFDDLRRRDLERRRRRWTYAASALLAIVAVLAGSLVFAVRERNAKARALQQVERLADSKTVRDLVREVDDLWPMRPDAAPPMLQWIGRAEDVLERRPLHEGARDTLRQRALPYSDEERERDHAGNRTQLTALKEEIAKASDQHAALNGKDDEGSVNMRKDLDAHIEGLETQSADIEALLKTRITWRLDDPKDAWKHQVLTDLLADMDRLLSMDGDQGLLKDVRARHEFVTSLRKRSIQDHDAAWQKTIDGISTSSKYGGLEIVPQLGLVPLGPDPESGLFEFAHVGSGNLPTRDPTTKQWVPDEKAAIVLVLIPAGSFLMGAQKEDPAKPNHDPLAWDIEMPVREVTISVPFFLSKYECTQIQWHHLTDGEDPSNYKAGISYGDAPLTVRNPVEQVSWTNAVLWLGRHRLEVPTEAQWEYACRARTSTPWFTGSDVTELSKVANIADAHLKNTASSGAGMDATMEVDDGHLIHAPVGSFAPNAFGLHDVHGNVNEWCRDSHGPYDKGPATDPFVNEMTGFRVIRGGSWIHAAFTSRASMRDAFGVDAAGYHIGIRPAMAVLSR